MIMMNWQKIIAAVEVIAVVMLAAFLFSLLGVTQLHQWEMSLPGGQKLYIIEYATVIILVCCLLAITHRNFIAYGFNFRHPKYLLTVVAISLIPFLILGGVLSLVNWRQWSGAIIVSLVSLGILVIVAWLLRKKPSPQETMVLGMFVLLVPNALISLDNTAGSVLIKTLYFYLLVGPAEEILFRGYVQSRINEVWGRPFTFFGVKWGWGVVFGAFLFGLWHVFLMPAVPGVWLQALWTGFAGLSLGFLREKSGSFVPSSILHSVINYIPFT
jgi:hypothetical protein